MNFPFGWFWFDRDGWPQSIRIERDAQVDDDFIHSPNRFDSRAQMQQLAIHLLLQRLQSSAEFQ